MSLMIARDPKKYLDKNGKLIRGSLDVKDWGESKTKQAEKDECDINKIIDRYVKNGIQPQNIREHLEYADVSSGQDFLDAMMIVNEGQAAFMELPATIRAKFGNDPAAFLDFVNNKDNGEELVKMGLAELRVETEVTPLASPKKAKAAKTGASDKTSSKAAKSADSESEASGEES